MKVSEKKEKVEKQPELIDPSPQIPDVSSVSTLPIK